MIEWEHPKSEEGHPTIAVSYGKKREKPFEKAILWIHPPFSLEEEGEQAKRPVGLVGRHGNKKLGI